MRRAAAAAALAVGATPWALTDNFIAALREGRGRLALTGAGDPTGRGIGFSLLRDARKARTTLPYPSTRPALPLLCARIHPLSVLTICTGRSVRPAALGESCGGARVPPCAGLPRRPA